MNFDTFERLWHLVTNSNFIHQDRVDEIMVKFEDNMRSMNIDPPQEAIDMYPNIFRKELVKESMDVMEPMADQEHDSWARWMEHLFKKSEKNDDGTVTIPKDKVDRWEKQMKTDYKDLSPSEKESDRKEVRKFLKIIKKVENK